LKDTNVLFIWDTGTELKKHLTKVFNKEKYIKLIFPKNFSKGNILKLCKDAEIIVGWRPSMEQLTAAEKLKLYINPGTGIKHHIFNFRDINKTREVVLVNGHGHAYSTAQHTVAMLMTLMNRILTHHILMTNGKWRTSDDKDLLSASVQLRDRKIGLLGYGAINKYVHRFLSGFENEFHVLKRNMKIGNPDLKFNERKVLYYPPEDLNKFLKAIDILIIAIPHTSKTEGMIGKKELKLLGKNSLLVNVARGLIVEEEGLYDALKNNIIGGAALDVWYNYQPKKDRKGREFPYKFPFHKLKNIVLSPHRAASPFDDIKRWDEVIENIRKVAEGKKDYLNIVDLNEEY
jgi:phosphoglycerate dehydrogenase-like enzyme